MNNSELKYPIKYAVLELTDENSKTFGFIVSKCYVVEALTKYLPDGNSRKYYKVVFPYTNIVDYKQKICYEYHTQDIGIRYTPNYDYFGEIYNGKVVDELFDNYDVAYVNSILKNKQLVEDLYSKLPIFHPNYEKEKEEISSKFSLNMSLCEKFEKLILEQTRDMIIVNEKDPPIDLEDFDAHKKMIRILINKEMEDRHLKRN